MGEGGGMGWVGGGVGWLGVWRWVGGGVGLVGDWGVTGIGGVRVGVGVGEGLGVGWGALGWRYNKAHLYLSLHTVPAGPQKTTIVFSVDYCGRTGVSEEKYFRWILLIATGNTVF